MSERNDKDLERTAEEALDRLARGWDPISSQADTEDEDEALVASQLEALSLLAYAVEPEAPSAEVKANVLRAAAAEPKAPRLHAVTPQAAAPQAVGPQAVGPMAVPTSAEMAPVDVTLHQLPAMQDDPGDMTLVGLGSADSDSGPQFDLDGAQNDPQDLGERTMRHAVGDDDYAPSTFTPPPRAANSNTPLYLLAAALVFCLVGLGYLYGQHGQLQQQNAQNIARQAQLQSQLQQVRTEAESMRARIQMVTDVARVAYPMQQVASTGGAASPVRAVSRPEPGEVRPDGIVYVCGQHQRWYLSLSGFDPAPDGKVYHLWFKTEDGAIDAGPVDLTEDGRADLADLSMPEGTQGFMVSLEDSANPEDGDGEPHGQIILKGDQPVKL